MNVDETLQNVLMINCLGSGCWDSTVNHWLTEIWPNKYAAVLQVNMFLSGLGDVVAPLMVAPYVHGDANVTADNETITVDLRIRHLTVPFALEGVLQSIGKHYPFLFPIESHSFDTFPIRPVPLIF